MEIRESLVLMHVKGSNKPSSITPLQNHLISPQDQSAADETQDTVRKLIENAISPMVYCQQDTIKHPSLQGNRFKVAGTLIMPRVSVASVFLRPRSATIGSTRSLPADVTGWSAGIKLG